MARKNTIATPVVENGVITFSFHTEPATERKFDAANASPELKERAMIHGFIQKLRDSYAGAKNPTEGVAFFDKVYSALAAGEWKAPRELTEDGPDVMVEAVRRYMESRLSKSVTYEEAEMKFSSLEDSAKRSLKQSADIIRIIADINAERSKKNAVDFLGL